MLYQNNFKPTSMSYQPINLDSARVLILGAGREGRAAAHYLYDNYPDCELSIADKQQLELELPTIEQRFDSRYPNSLDQWDTVVVSPGIPPQLPLLSTASNITTSTNIFFQDCKGTIVGVTGSKGKSTTSSLIYEIFKMAKLPVSLVGNIGYPALAELHDHNNPEDIFIFEISSYQARYLEKGPDIAVITNLFPDHLDYHGSVGQYYSDKLRITTQQNDSQIVIYNNASQNLVARIDQSPAIHIAWPDQQNAYVQDGKFYFKGDQLAIVSSLKLLGEHNVSNVLGAITVAKHFNIENRVIAQALASFSPLPHRLEQIGTYNNITFINDSLATTPEATSAAIQSFNNISTILLGGQDRGYEFDKLAQLIKKRKIPNIVFFPDSGNTIRQALEKINYSPNYIETTAMKEAISFAYANSSADSVCLMSCASPSYSIFRNYEDRGNQFRENVQQLGMMAK